MNTLISLLFIFFGCIDFSYLQECPQPKVQKRTIIRSAASIENGAKLLYKLTVSSARDCYQECCTKKDCNVAVMHYKQADYTEEMKKFCFLFDCKSPSVCTFDAHNRYAIIEIPKMMRSTTNEIKTTQSSLEDNLKSKVKNTERLLTSTSNPPPSTTTTPKQHPEQHGECPADAPTAMCAANPCDTKVCDSQKDAVCKPSYCGGCYAKFYKQGKEVQCTVEDVKHEEIVDVASTDYEETPVDELPQPSKLAQPTGDPYFNSERRTWVDGKEPGHLIDATTPSKDKHGDNTNSEEKKVIVVNNTFMSVPLFIALCICILLMLGLIYRFKCSGRGKPKKFPVDDGDYLINGMYL